MKGDRNIGGLLCSEVLAHLSDYIDRALDDATRAKVEAHVAGCDVCERFGGSVGASVAALKRQRAALAEDRSMDSALARLRAALPGERSQ